MAVSMGDNLVDAFRAYKIQQDRLVQVERLDSAEAREAAQHLAKASKTFTTRLLQDPVPSEREVSDTPFPLAYRLIQMLAQPEIQCYDGLKEEVSKAARILVELVVFQCGVESRRLQTRSVELMRSSLREVITTLPDQEVISRFELKCAEAAVKKLDYGVGKWKMIRREAFKDIGTGLLEVLLSASPTGVSLSSLARPCINVAASIYKALEDSWYKNIWLLSLSSPEASIKTRVQLDGIITHFQGYKKNPKLAFYISRLFKEIIDNPDADDDFKNSLVHRNDLSLTTLVQIEAGGPPIGEDKFWETRCYTLILLGDLAFKYRVENLISERFFEIYEKDTRVRERAGSVIASFAQRAEDLSKLKQSIKAGNQVQKQAVEDDLKGAAAGGVTLHILNKRIEEVERALESKQLTASLVQPSLGIVEQSVGGRPSSTDSSSEEELLNLQHAKAHYRETKERLLNLEAQLALSEQVEEALKTGNWDFFRFPDYT